MFGKRLQRLAADEVAPPAHLGWYSLGLGQLLAHALGEKDGGLGRHVSDEILQRGD